MVMQGNNIKTNPPKRSGCYINIQFRPTPVFLPAHGFTGNR
jgi:hypothetical protein